MAGAGFAIYQSGKQFLQSSIPLGPNKEVFDAEAEAALAGAKAAFQLHTACYATNLWICLDNLEVATRLLSPFTGSSQEVFESFRALAETCGGLSLLFSRDSGGAKSLLTNIASSSRPSAFDETRQHSLHRKETPHLPFDNCLKVNWGQRYQSRRC
jgi:hypothetical protein